MEASVEQLVFVRDDAYTVARMSADGRAGFVAAGRALGGVQPGETVRLAGAWEEHPRHGRRYAVTGCERVTPSTVRAIQIYLGSGLIRGIGPRLAQAIVGHFGERSLAVIDEEPGRLREVINIGPVRQAQIVEAWHEQKAVAELMVVLQGFGVSPLLAAKIYQVFGAESGEVLAKDPYQLIGRVRGIAFATADRIALRSGVPESSPQRIQAALLDRLDAAASGGGHCFLSPTALVTQTIALIEQDEELIRQGLDALTAERRVVRESDAVYPKELHSRELRLTAELARLARARSTLPLRSYQEDESLDDDQRAAVTMALTSTLSILTGGPGCGKSHTVRALAATVRAMGGAVTLCAPTGKAAKRLSELAGLPAMTIHRALAHEPDPDALFDETPVRADLVVVDEVSMLDLGLATRLAAALPSGTHLLLVGDSDQLPSVGPGSVLADLLAVESIPRVRLTRVFRQAEGSAIIRAAHRIRTGDLPELPGGGGFWFEALDDPEAIADRVVHLATVAIPRKQQISPAQVQVLSPMRKGTTGTTELGRRLQEVRNPAADDKPEHWSGSTVFRVGDRVMPIRNNYDKGVFNGETGTLTRLVPEERQADVQIDDGDLVTYTFDELDDLTHAYAISVHRAQGSEYPIVVAPLVAESGGIMLRRRLLYTLVTRARAWVVLVGQRNALDLAVHRLGHRRNTSLTTRLEATGL
ncbi:ATP-dependent RecD-like DNA helicase [Nonomuraea sp. NPDC050790]|uniref:SF1B family DNA helicase RecD2 n=1 Tax=Nonomuraea sp. NPDC050790 TaxID=3364371 RepID=UPI00379716D8